RVRRDAGLLLRAGRARMGRHIADARSGAARRVRRGAGAGGRGPGGGGWVAAAALTRFPPRMVLPRGHGRHVRQRPLLGDLPLDARLAPHHPLDHALEALVERLQLSRVVDAVLAVGPRLDRHTAALTLHCDVSFRGPAAATRARMPSMSFRRSPSAIAAIARASSPRTTT